MFSLNNHLTVSQMQEKDFNKFDTAGQFNDLRGLKEYIDCSDASLKNSLDNLQQNEVWVDIGCGHARAIKQYIKSHPNGGHAIGITILRPIYKVDSFINADKNNEKLNLYLGDFLKLPMDSLHSRVSLITDILGVFQYSGQLNSTLEKIYRLLHCGGKAFISFTYAQTYFSSVTIMNPDGSNRHESPKVVLLWLKTVKGFHISQRAEEHDPTNIALVLERTPEPFYADPFYIRETLSHVDDRSILHKVADSFKHMSIKKFQNQDKWCPPGNDSRYIYDFYWEINQDSENTLKSQDNQF